MKKYILIACLAAMSIALSLTEFYSLGYLIVVLLSVAILPSFFIFKTGIQRFVLSLLLFLAVTPIVALVCWLFGVANYPLLNLLGFIGIVALLSDVPFRDAKRDAYLPIFDKADLVAIVLAALPVIVMSLSYFTSPNNQAALFQLSSEGWDNGSHIIMMHNNSASNGYVYGPYGELKDKLVEAFNAYPQSWHLATANFVNGFGGNRFIPTQPMGTILAYTIATITWLMVLSYIFTVSMWRFYEYSTKNKQPKTIAISVISVVTLLTYMVVFIAAFMHGFTNYIGTLAYMCLAIAMMVEFMRNDNTKIYSLFILFSLAAVMSWFLTLPAFAVAFVLLILARYGNIRNGLLVILRNWRMATVTVIAILSALLQVYIFQQFSVVGGESQLNVGSLVTPFKLTGSPLHISHVLFGVIVALLLTYLFKAALDKKIQTLLLITVAPWVALVVFVYVYQNVTAGQNSYYLTKVVGLCFVAIMIPLGALIASTLAKVRIPNANFTMPLLTLLLAPVILLGTGQPLYGLNKLFQKHARTTYSTAEKVVGSLPQTTDGNTYIVVLTDRKSYEGSREDYHGKLEMRVVNQPYNCTYYITSYNSVSDKVKRLSDCADELAKDGKKIIVITSKGTRSKVEALQKDNIIVVRS